MTTNEEANKVCTCRNDVWCPTCIERAHDQHILSMEMRDPINWQPIREDDETLTWIFTPNQSRWVPWEGLGLPDKKDQEGYYAHRKRTS